MWKITTRGFTLEEVLIMAVMNLLTSVDTAAKREKPASQKSKKDQDLKVTAPRITERDLRHGVVQCNHCKLLSIPIRPVLNLSSATLACCVLFPCCRSNEVLRRTYGKDNRVLHTAKLSQGFKVVLPSRTWQAAGISTRGTKIRVSGSETRTAKLRLSKVKQQS